MKYPLPEYDIVDLCTALRTNNPINLIDECFCFGEPWLDFIRLDLKTHFIVALLPALK